MRILLFANTDWYLYNFRLPLARALQQVGHEVILLSPPGQYVQRLEQQGFRWVRFHLSRHGMNPFEDLLVLIRLIGVYRSLHPDLVHHFTIKCVLYGSLAAQINHVPTIVNSVTGLGSLFTDQRRLVRLVQILARFMYRLALRNTAVIFQNPDDRREFVNSGLVRLSQTILIRSSGVDVNQFLPTAEPDGPPVVLFVGRLLWEKGIGDFVEAARILRTAGCQARFVLIGIPDSGNPQAVSSDKLKVWKDEGVVELWGWQENMWTVYSRSALVCLPSHYREGVPKTLIEAAACGRPVLATDVPGCREAVMDGVNGFLVPPRNALALAQVMQRLIESPELRKKMGLAGRKIVVDEFSLEKVVQETLAVYGKI